MDEIMSNKVVEEVNSTKESVTDDALKDAIEVQLRKIQRQNLLIGSQTVCTVILEKIMRAMNQPGKRTMNDYKRVIKDIENFCRTGISRKINADGEVEVVNEETVAEDTVQN